MICPSLVLISLRFIFMIPAMMFPPFSVARLMLISMKSFGLSSFMVMSLFTENALVALDAISEVKAFPACWKVSLQGNLTESFSYLMVSESS